MEKGKDSHTEKVGGVGAYFEEGPKELPEELPSPNCCFYVQVEGQGEKAR